MDLVDLLAPEPAPPGPSSSWWWATVTGVAPLRIRLDPDDAPLEITPASLVAGLAVDDRVWCQMYAGAGASKQLVVHGKAV